MNPSNFCTYCKQLRWCSLPSEEEDAVPHQPSIDSLEKSAQTCALCALILWAAGCSLAGVGGMVCFKPKVRLPSGKEVSVKEVESNYNSIGMRTLDNGAAMLDFSSPQPDYRAPISHNPSDLIPEDIITRIRPWLFGTWWKSPRPNMPLQLVGLGVRLGTSPRIEDTVDCKDDEINFRGSFLRLRVNHESPAADWMIPGTVRHADSGSLMAFEQLKKWLKGCDEHDNCIPKDVSHPLPTRVLEVVRGEDMVILRETKGQRGKYIALSHCWGTTHRLTTTRANVNALRDGIVLSQLPATFRDAVYIAEQLNIRYIWIDSLCIIQDDAADWELEAAKMGDVYAHSYLSVAALSSSDDSSGCFPDPDTRYDEPFVSSDVRSTGRRCISFAAPVIKLEFWKGELSTAYMCRALFAMKTLDDDGSSIFITPEWMPSSTKSSPKLYVMGAFGGRFDPIADEPLSKRAWTMQERLLAPRTIHYGRTEMYWECQHIVRTEDGAFLPRKFTRLQDIAGPRSKPSEDRHWPASWFRLVEEYSSRDLTREEDKLPALSGLANLIARDSGDDYFAGIWKSNFIDGLNWSVESYEPHHNCNDPEHDASMPHPKKSTVKCPTDYRAPSWSWASLDATIQYGSLDKVRLTSYIEVHVTPVGEDPFGKVKFAYARLKGPVCTLSQRSPKGREAITNTLSTPVYSIGSDGVRDGSANFDLTPKFPCVALFLDNSHALILQEKVGGTFTRVGLALFYGASRSQGDSEDCSFETPRNATGEVREVVIE